MKFWRAGLLALLLCVGASPPYFTLGWDTAPDWDANIVFVLRAAPVPFDPVKKNAPVVAVLDNSVRRYRVYALGQSQFFALYASNVVTGLESGPATGPAR